jgi:ATP synthase F1 epsilon subunit
MILDIVTPDRRMHFTLGDEPHQLPEDVLHVLVPGVEGDFQVLNRHAPFFSLLRTGIVQFQIGLHKVQLMVSGGFCEVGADRVTILTEQAAYADEVDAKAEEEQLKRALKELEALGAVGTDQKDYKKFKAAADQAQTKLSLSKDT